MIILDDLKTELVSYRKDINELSEVLNISQAKETIKKLQSQMEEPNFWDDLDNSQKIVQQSKTLQNKVEHFNQLQTKLEDIITMIELSIEEQDDSMVDEVTTEVKSFKTELEDIKLSTLLSGEYDTKNAILTFHAGAGGTEAQDWAEMLYRMYNRWAERHNFSVKLLDYLDGDEAGLKSASILVEGENAYGFLKSEAGVHRLVRISPFDASGRRHTSFSAVEVMPEIDDTIEIDIRPEDLKVDTYRSSGAGGQHINKTESAVRITHIPTGVVVECQDERSQYKNKDRAMKILRSRLYDSLLAEQNEKIASERRSQVGTGDRSERIRTYNYPQGRFTDHRINLTIYQLESILNGNLDEVFDALATADQAKKLAMQED